MAFFSSIFTFRLILSFLSKGQHTYYSLLKPGLNQKQFCLSLVPLGPKCVSIRNHQLNNKQTNKQEAFFLEMVAHRSNSVGGWGLVQLRYCIGWLRDPDPGGTPGGPVGVFFLEMAARPSNSVGGCGLVQLRYCTGWLRDPEPREPPGHHRGYFVFDFFKTFF